MAVAALTPAAAGPAAWLLLREADLAKDEADLLRVEQAATQGPPLGIVGFSSVHLGGYGSKAKSMFPRSCICVAEIVRRKPRGAHFVDNEPRSCLRINHTATGLPVAFPIVAVADKLAALLDASDTGSAVVGVGTVGVKSVWMWGRAMRCGVIFDLRVRGEARRLGLGAAVTSALESFAWSEGAAFTYLSVNAGNKRAQSLYDKLGYSLCARRAIAFELVTRQASLSSLVLQGLSALLSPGNDARFKEDLDAARVPGLPPGTRLRVRVTEAAEAGTALSACWGLEASAGSAPPETAGAAEGGTAEALTDRESDTQGAVWRTDDAATRPQLVMSGGKEELGGGTLVAPPATPASVMWLRNNARSAGYPPGYCPGVASESGPSEEEAGNASVGVELSRAASIAALADVAAMSAAMRSDKPDSDAEPRRAGAVASAAPDLAPLASEALLGSGIGLCTVCVEAVCDVAAAGDAADAAVSPAAAEDHVTQAAPLPSTMTGRARDGVTSRRRRQDASSRDGIASPEPRAGGGAERVVASAQVSVVDGSHFGGMMLVSGLWMPGHRLVEGAVPWLAWLVMILAVAGSGTAVWGWTGGAQALTNPLDWIAAVQVWLAWVGWAGFSALLVGGGAVLGAVLQTIAAPERAFDADGCAHGETARKVRLFAPATAGAAGSRLLPVAVATALKQAGELGGIISITNLAENHPFSSALGAWKPRNQFLWKPRPVGALTAGGKVHDEPFEGTIRSYDCFDPRDL